MKKHLFTTLFIITIISLGVIAMSPFSFEAIQPFLNKPSQEPLFFIASDKTKLASYPFLPNSPRAIIIFYHGGGIWSGGIYQNMASKLAQDHAIGTYLMDIRGHGNSEGKRGDSPSTEQVWQDITTTIHAIKQLHPITPLFLAGHSSGAGLILNYSNWQKNPLIDGYLFLSPFLGPNSITNRCIADPTKKFIKKVRVWVFIGKAITGWNIFDHIPTIYFNYPAWLMQQDPKILSYYTCAMAQATSPVDAQKIFVQLDKPFGLYVGENDEQFLPEEIMKYKEFAAQVKNQSIAKIIPEASHLSIISNAPDIFADIINSWGK